MFEKGSKISLKTVLKQAMLTSQDQKLLNMTDR